MLGACLAPRAPDKEPLLALLWMVLVYLSALLKSLRTWLSCPCRRLASPGAEPHTGAPSLLLEACPIWEDTVSQVLGLNSALFALSLFILSLVPGFIPN